MCVLSLLLFVGCGKSSENELTNTTAGDNNVTSNAANDTDSASGGAQVDQALTYYADIDIKDYGMITVKLNQKEAPATVANFISLSESGFYDGLTFHRIMEGFMMQGGAPKGNSNGGSPNKIKGEFKMNGHNNTISHKRGVISMARAQDYNSGSSQFFIVHEDSEFLDGQYAAFGMVTSGLDVVDKVCKESKPIDNNGTIPAQEQPVINSIKIRTE